MSEVFGDDFPELRHHVLNDTETRALRAAEAAARQFAVGAQAALPVSNTGRELVLVEREDGVLLSSVAPGSAAVVLEFIVTEDEQ